MSGDVGLLVDKQSTSLVPKRRRDDRGHAGVEFSWEGVDEGDEVSGRGWAALTETGEVEGRIFFHNGDDSGFRAVRV
ncbi:hypothetical protein AB0M54_15715 [Actinoplanes sp. NPDC051470]|uniref:hypothetical protein n=1 Tax=Actinoplanes sp. NPDC051470 TaxID=3157224 RepID=UPI0034229179